MARLPAHLRIKKNKTQTNTHMLIVNTPPPLKTLLNIPWQEDSPPFSKILSETTCPSKSYVNVSKKCHALSVKLLKTASMLQRKPGPEKIPWIHTYLKQPSLVTPLYYIIHQINTRDRFSLNRLILKEWITKWSSYTWRFSIQKRFTMNNGIKYKHEW